jgi:hypothetical protein
MVITFEDTAGAEDCQTVCPSCGKPISINDTIAGAILEDGDRWSIVHIGCEDWLRKQGIKKHYLKRGWIPA